MDATKAVHKHEANMHPGKAPTRFRAGGKTNADMLKMGRNLAKVANQKATGGPRRSSGRGG